MKRRLGLLAVAAAPLLAEHWPVSDAQLGALRGRRDHPRIAASERFSRGGKTPDGGSVTWRYDLMRMNGEWKPRDQTRETRFEGQP